jgi:hypothetical protein
MFDSPSETVFSHRNTLLQYISFNNKLGDTNVSKLKTSTITSNSNVNTLNNLSLCSFTVKYNVSTSTYSVAAGVNGESLVYQTDIPDALVSSTLQTFGGYFDGAVYQNGFGGRFSDFILTKSTDIFTIQKYEGYLA